MEKTRVLDDACFFLFAYITMKKPKNNFLIGNRKMGTNLKKNIIYQLAYQLLLLILPFVTSPYISRVVGADGLGIYSYSHAVACYFEIFALLGIANYGNRLIAQSRDNPDEMNKHFSNLLAVHVFGSVLVFLSYVLYVCLGNDSFYAALQIPYVLCTVFDISWFYFGIEQIKVTVIKNFVIKVLTVVLIFCLVKERNDLWKYCLIMAFASLASTTSLWISINKYVRFVKPTWKEMRVHIAPLIALFIPVIALSIHSYMDKIMIGMLSDKAELGYYENAEKVRAMAVSIINAFGVVMLPKMSNLFSNNKQNDAFVYLEKSVELIMCLAIAISFGLAAISKTFAIAFWGRDFSDSGIIILGFSITIPFTALANILRTQYLIPKSKDKEYTCSILIGALVNLICNYLLIPSYGAMGATIGTILSEFSVCIIQIMMVRKEVPVKKYIINILPFIPIGFIMYICLKRINNRISSNWTSIVVQVLLGGIIYSILAGFLLEYKKNPIISNTKKNIGKGGKKDGTL